MARKKAPETSERRQYIRLDSVFPVEFQLVDMEDRRPVSELREGFTRDVAKGGMGITAKTLKAKDEDFFTFRPNETKLKLTINIPLDNEPVQCFATVEWVTKEPGPLLDTYYFGVSYDFINELEYEKIMGYAKWLRLKPRLILSALVATGITMVLALYFLFSVNARRIQSERQLEETIVENTMAQRAKEYAEKRHDKARSHLEQARRKEELLMTAFEKLAEEKETLEQVWELSNEERRDLQQQLEEAESQRDILEEQALITEASGGAGISSGKASIETEADKLASRIKSEESIYKKLRECILNEKVQSLDAYLSSVRSSIYHAAGLFALAELRYKERDLSLAEVTYDQVIELYPNSKYALYASHRLDQLDDKHWYENQLLIDFYERYDLPPLLDYRNIEPYLK